MPKEIHPYAVLRGPILTEKSTELTEIGKYVFEVDPRANKVQIKEAVEEIVYGKCDVGPCELIPGLVYDSETKQCSWPDEVGCSFDGKLKVIN